LENLGKYVALNPLFADVVEFLKNHDLQELEIGKYIIKDNDLLLNLQKVKQRSMDAEFLDSHCKMIDIQIPLSCEETYGYTPQEDHACFND
jgi:YhcH/YjgK/YiaL family protein